MKKITFFVLLILLLLFSSIKVYGYWIDKLEVKVETPIIYDANIEVIYRTLPHTTNHIEPSIEELDNSSTTQKTELEEVVVIEDDTETSAQEAPLAQEGEEKNDTSQETNP